MVERKKNSCWDIKNQYKTMVLTAKQQQTSIINFLTKCSRACNDFSRTALSRHV